MDIEPVANGGIVCLQKIPTIRDFVSGVLGPVKLRTFGTI